MQNATTLHGGLKDSAINKTLSFVCAWNALPSNITSHQFPQET